MTTPNEVKSGKKVYLEGTIDDVLSTWNTARDYIQEIEDSEL
jgi:hypothetical protein